LLAGAVLAGCSSSAAPVPPAPPPKATAALAPPASAPDAAEPPSAAAADAVAAAPADAATPKETKLTEAAKPAAPVKPATADEAAQVLDLRTFPLLPSTTKQPPRTIGRLDYQAPGKPKEAYKFIQEKLVAQGWKELPQSYVTDESASGAFAKSGYKLTVSCSAYGEPGEVGVAMVNHGNIDTKDLPTPQDAKSAYNVGVSSGYVTESSVEDTVAATRELLVAQGWTPYGEAGDSYNFKQNAVKISAMISSAPAQGGKTMIQYSSELLSYDLPAPPGVEDLRYTETPTQLFFDTTGSYDDVSKFYRTALAKQGWKATTENLVKIDWKHFLIFRNPQKDLLEVELTTVDEKTRALVRFKTAEEVAAEEKVFADAKKRREAEANKPKPKLAIALPADAESVEAAAGSLDFAVAAGKAKAAVEALQKQLVADGWKVETSTMEAMFGMVDLKKGDHTISLMYVETGVLAPEISIRAFGLELEAKK
jgi:hypothetical protein